MPNNNFEQQVRKNQVISPWGIGAIVPLPKNRSVMVAGLDMWSYGSSISPYLINDDRLRRHLGVDELREPPTEKRNGEDTHLTIPAVLFPLWHYCPDCGRMEKLNPSSNDRVCYGPPENPHKKPVKMIPERFVAICPHGHIQDFPVLEWVHKGTPLGPSSQHQITRKVKGSSTTLAAVEYECSCGKSASLLGATSDDALSCIGVRCSGNRPWLGDQTDNCNAELKVVQAGGSNVWFPIIKSSIWIPPVNRTATLLNEIHKYESLLGMSVSSDENGEHLDPAIAESVATLLGISLQELQGLWDTFKGVSDSSSADEAKSEDDYRFDEYEVLCADEGLDSGSFLSRRVPIEEYDGLAQYFDGVTLVRKLQETRAFVGFSRVQPNMNISTKESLLQLSLNSGTSWAPAIKVFGEGIFLQFSAERINSWRKIDSTTKRVAKMDHAYKRAAARWGNIVTGKISPEYVLIHTFSHLLINRLSFDCGYGSSSIRERIYCRLDGDDTNTRGMYGLLLYTASGDSEGSLGGLVRMGEPRRLENTILHALKDALWCSSDPVCSQSEGQGPDSCNLAACHNCALLPETCCENGNRLLDRLLVVSGGESDSGYFDI